MIPDLESAYAEMAKDIKREKEALSWAEATFNDAANEMEVSAQVGQL